MDTTYFADLVIPQSWPADSYGDWLHPSHGPLPDHLGMVRACGESFQIALWDLPACIVTAAEIVEQERTPGELERAMRMRGWILYTLTWHMIPHGFETYGCKILVPDFKPGSSEEEWIRRNYRQIMMGTAELAATQPMGATLERWTK